MARSSTANGKATNGAAETAEDLAREAREAATAKFESLRAETEAHLAEATAKAEQAAAAASDAYANLREKDLPALVDEAGAFVRKHPIATVAGAAALGFVAARLLGGRGR